MNTTKPVYNVGPMTYNNLLEYLQIVLNIN